MASTLCNHPHLLRISTAEIPAKSPIAGVAILHATSSLIPRTLIHARTLAGTPKAEPSQKHVYPDPIPEFAAAKETQKFKLELLGKLSKEKDTFGIGDELQTVANVCVEIFGEFLNKEYAGRGTLLIEPFTDMMVAKSRQSGLGNLGPLNHTNDVNRGIFYELCPTEGVVCETNTNLKRVL